MANSAVCALTDFLILPFGLYELDFNSTVRSFERSQLVARSLSGEQLVKIRSYRVLYRHFVAQKLADPKGLSA